MTGELTLEILDAAIAKIREMEYKDEIVGLALNPVDMKSIEDGAKVAYAVTNDQIKVSSRLNTYTGLELYVSELVPPGCPLPLRRKDARP